MSTVSENQRKSMGSPSVKDSAMTSKLQTGGVTGIRSGSMDGGLELATTENAHLFPLSKADLFKNMEGTVDSLKCSIEFTDTVTLTNESKKTILWRVNEPSPGAHQHWFLTVGPTKKGELKKGKNITLEFLLRVFSRKNEISQKIDIIVSPKPKATVIGSKKEDPPTLTSVRFTIPPEDSSVIDEKKEDKKTQRSPKDSILQRVESEPMRKSNSGFELSTPERQTSTTTNLQENKPSLKRPTVDHYELAPKLDNGVIPQENLQSIGWMGEISRNDTASKLSLYPPGTFLFRWSNTTQSYVLSYVKQDNEVHHIAQIKRKQGTKTAIQVMEQDNNLRTYNSMLEFVDEMKSHGILKNPIPINQESIAPYSLSPPNPNTVAQKV